MVAYNLRKDGKKMEPTWSPLSVSSQVRNDEGEDRRPIQTATGAAILVYRSSFAESSDCLLHPLSSLTCVENLTNSEHWRTVEEALSITRSSTVVSVNESATEGIFLNDVLLEVVICKYKCKQ
jgi:hypothetical protein